MQSISNPLYLMILTLVLTVAGENAVAQQSTTSGRAPQEKAVQFSRASFQYDPTVFGNVKSETVPAQPLEEESNKPDGVAPEHILFTFEFGRADRDVKLAVYPLDGFPKAYSVNPKLAKSMRQEIKGLKEVLKDTLYRHDGKIPHLPFEDVSDDFYVRVRHFNFLNGNGVLFVTHWSHGAALVSNRNLLYRYEGITEDGKYYVTAEMPISVDFLPYGPPDRFEGFTYENLFESYRRPEAKRRYDDYIKSITDRIKKLEPADFRPNLQKFESMIASLRIRK